MLSTVESKPNHYETLALAPDAGEEEIERAFAREMGALRPHSIGDMARIALAFETLRDPARRRAYDASIAPPPEPEPETRPEPVQEARFPREGWPFIASARIGSADLPAIDSVTREVRKPPVEPAPEPFIASPARQVADAPSPPVSDRMEAEASRPFAPPHALEEHFREDDGRVDWAQPAMTVGALFVGVAILGAGLGVYASRGIDPAQAQDTATVTLPKEAKPADPDPVAAEAEAKASEPKPAPRRTASRHRRVASAPEPVAAREERVEDVPDITSEQVAALTSEAAQVPAAMPLSNSVVARTIERIGYSCGKVASTSGIDGSAGVFKVTCTSGDSFKATPIRGRYHFRRLSR